MIYDSIARRHFTPAQWGKVNGMMQLDRVARLMCAGFGGLALVLLLLGQWELAIMCALACAGSNMVRPMLDPETLDRLAAYLEDSEIENLS